LAVSEARQRGKLKKNMADAADGEDEFSFLLDQRGYFSQQKAKLLLGHTEKRFIRHDIPHFKLSYQLIETRPSPLSGKSIVAYTLSDFVFEAFPRLRHAKGPNRAASALFRQRKS